VREFHYPVYLDLRGRDCVVVGGGEVAYGKVLGLLPCGARVRVISPEVHPGIARFAARGKLAWEPRPYRPGDLRGAFLAIAATDDAAENGRVYDEAVAEKALVNVVDVPERCQFIAAAVFRRGRLTAAISTGGASPALAGRLKRELSAQWGPEYGQLTSLYRRLRPLVMQRIPSLADRKRFWLHLAAQDEPLRLLRARRRDELEAWLARELAQWGAADPDGAGVAARPGAEEA
jgi:precorrin-2 dehydrogenase/sirohydrochlorin ferrochelatase